MTNNFYELATFLLSPHNKVMLPCIAASFLLIGIVLAADDPDFDATPQQLILSRGFEYQRHDIKTADGYILRTDRIVNPYRTSAKPPVVLMHGFIATSRDFIINSPGGSVNESLDVVGNNLGFELAKRGYDVWIPNERGNTYSQNHVLYPAINGNNLDPSYWDFSYADMAKYSIPAIIDYVKSKTQAKTIAYVGHSRGTMVMFGALSIYPYLNRIVKPVIAMSPVMTLSKATPGIRFLAKLPVSEYMLGGSFNFPILFGGSMAKVNCPNGPDDNIRCAGTFKLMGGDGIELFNVSRVNVLANGIPGGASSKDLKLFRQNIRTGKFADFDYGPQKNMQLYNSTEPPVFPMERIENHDICLISGIGDVIANPEDTITIRKTLGPRIKKDITIPIPAWGHLAMLYGKEAGKYVNTPILEILSEYD